MFYGWLSLDLTIRNVDREGKAMNIHFVSWEPLIAPIIFIVGGFILGLIFQKIILREIKKIAARTKWEGDDVIIHGLHGMTIFWFVAAGVYGALRYVDINPALSSFFQKGLMIFVVLSVTLVLAKILVGFVNLYTRKVGGALLSTSMFANLTRILVFILGILIILQHLGISIAPILTALGVGGLAVALALQETLSNLFAGIQMIASKQIKPGDYVKLGSGEEGYISDITWRYTTIQALPNNVIIIPNAKLAAAIVTNYNYPEKELAVSVRVGVSYDSDLEIVEKIVIEVAKEVMTEVPGGVPDSEPFIRYHTFNDSSIDFNVILRGSEFANQYLIRHEFIKRLHRRFKAENIEIPFPVRTVYMQGKI
jgi:small-conductance mechanosensitive channel